QYSQLIARRVRELGVFSELLPHHVALEEVERRRPRGLILSGGPASVYADGAPKLDKRVLELGIPVLGICYGMQLVAVELGGRVGDANVICGLSGGVDSSVAAMLVHRAIGDQLTCVFVDHGLMRKNEGEQVIAAFRDRFHVPLVAVDASDRFLGRLAGVSDPETKRKIIGEEFIRVTEEEAAKVEAREGGVRFLVQGTLYSDAIESGGGTGAPTTKSHHNLRGLPE